MRQHCQRRAGHTELRHTSWGKTDDDTVFQLEWLELLADTELSIVDDEDD